MAKVHGLLIIVSLLTACRGLSPHASDFQQSSPTAILNRTSSGTAPPTRAITKAPPGRFPTCSPFLIKAGQHQQTSFPIAEAAPIGPSPTPPLRELAEARGFFVGAAVTPWLFADEFLARLLSQQFNLIAAENAMKWETLHPEPNRFDFDQGDALISFAQRYKMAVFAHVLVWDLQMPGWVTEADHSRSEWINILCRHIKTVVHHYRGQVYAWNVVNEAIKEDGTLRNTFWMRKIGPEHIAMAFQWAREADPDALLFYNDNGGEGLNSQSQAIYMLVKNLLAAGIPIDGVGLQMHTAIYNDPTPEDLRANMQRLADLGMEIHITEMDVRLQYAKEEDNVKLAAQAETYQRVIDTCLAVKKCRGFTTWGLIDRFSWIPGWTGSPDAPLLFDDNARPKPAYFAVQEALSQP